MTKKALRTPRELYKSWENGYLEGFSDAEIKAFHAHIKMAVDALDLGELFHLARVKLIHDLIALEKFMVARDLKH